MIFRLNKRCRLRYSLRALGVLLTIICIWLGMLASSARKQRLATAQLRSIDATVGYGNLASRVPQWLRNCIGDDFFLTVVEVQLHDRERGRKASPFSPDDLKIAVDAMSRLPHLRSIEFENTCIHDEDLQYLAPLAKQIESLTFNEPSGNITGEGFQYLAGWPRLRELHVFSAPRLHSEALSHLPALPALERLHWEGELDDTAFENIARCRHLKTLSLGRSRFDGQSLVKLRLAPLLRSVTLQNCTPEAVGVIETTDLSGKFLSRSAPTSYRFHPTVMEDPSTFSSFTDTHYRQWLQNLLPGVTINEMCEVN